MRVIFDGRCPGTHPLSEIKKFESDDILLIYDSFDDSELDKLIALKGAPSAIFNESFSFYESRHTFPIYCTDIWLEKELQRFRNLPMITDPVTEYSANFVINKKQINRYLAMKLVEYFNIPVDYTWSGIGEYFDMSGIIKEWNSISFDEIPLDVRNHLLSPVRLPAKWIDYRNNPGNEAGVPKYGGNIWSWTHGIDKVVSCSAVSIITESIWTQRAMHFTEKTLYAILGLTFPLWVGGYHQADEWRKIGFDAFDDVINHDYQHHPTLIERCWWAIKLNSELLQDIGALRALRKKHLDRLVSNRENMIFGDHFYNYNNQVMSAWPKELQQSIEPIVSYFR